MTKPTMWLCAQRRLRSALASAQSSLSAWRKFGSLATHWVHSKDSDQTGRMPRLIWVFAGCIVILLVLSRGGSNIKWAFGEFHTFHMTWRVRFCLWYGACLTALSGDWSWNNFYGHSPPSADSGERGGSVVECRTLEREVRGSRPTAAVLCPWARHFTPRKYWLITQEAMAPSRHDWKIVDWDVKPQHNQPSADSRRALVSDWWK